MWYIFIYIVIIQQDYLDYNNWPGLKINPKISWKKCVNVFFFLFHFSFTRKNKSMSTFPLSSLAQPLCFDHLPSSLMYYHSPLVASGLLSENVVYFKQKSSFTHKVAISHNAVCSWQRGGKKSFLLKCDLQFVSHQEIALIKQGDERWDSHGASIMNHKQKLMILPINCLNNLNFSRVS